MWNLVFVAGAPTRGAFLLEGDTKMKITNSYFVRRDVGPCFLISTRVSLYRKMICVLN